MMRTAPTAALLLTVVAMLSGCFSPNTSVQFRLWQEKVVGKINDQHRTGKIYRDLDTIFIGDAIWQSAALRRFYLDEMKQKGRISEEEYRQKTADLEESDKKEITFMGAFYTSEDKWDDFSQSGSIWNLRLVGKDGGEVKPLSVTRRKLKDIPDAHLYRFLNEFKSVYIITFPRNRQTAGLKEYRLRVYSVLGDTAFTWQTDKAEQAKPPYSPANGG